MLLSEPPAMIWLFNLYDTASDFSSERRYSSFDSKFGFGFIGRSYGLFFWESSEESEGIEEGWNEDVNCVLSCIDFQGW